MNKKLVTILASSVLATSILSVGTFNPVKADTLPTSQSQATYKSLLTADSGLGNASSAFGLTGTGINNYEAIQGGNSQHLYMPTTTTEVFNLKLNSNFKAGGSINLLPDYSNNAGSDIPVIVDQVYAYDSVTGNKVQVTNTSSGFTLTKSASGYSIKVPSDTNIGNYTLVFTISPLNSKETSKNAYQHPSYGVNVSASSNDGYVDGSSYTNNSWGILWGQFDYSTPVQLKTNQATITTGTNYDLDSQVTNASDYTSSKWVLRDSTGNTLTTPISDLKAGTYYETYYGSYQGTVIKYAWDTIQLNVKNADFGNNTSNNTGDNGNNNSSNNESNPNNSSNGSEGSSNVSPESPSANTNTSNNNPAKEPVSPVTPNPNKPSKVFKPYFVYAIKKISLYKSVKFNKDDLITKFAKSKRINRPVFKAIGVTGNKLKVISYNKSSYKKIGYIYKNAVANLYYKSGNYRTNGLYVINPKGINS